MKREIRDKWVAALRSGEYKQGTSVLRRSHPGGDTFCCLGVLCDLAEKEGIISSEIKVDAFGEPMYYYGAYDAFLPGPVRVWSGVGEAPSPFADSEHNTLVYLNDEAGYNFNEIADVIEASF